MSYNVRDRKAKVSKLKQSFTYEGSGFEKVYASQVQAEEIN